MKVSERLAQALHSVGLFELEILARDGEWDDMQLSPERKRRLVHEIDSAMRNSHYSSFSLQLMWKLQEAIIRGGYDS